MTLEARKLHYVRLTADKHNVYDTKTVCEHCQGKVGLLDDYCRRCGAKFFEVMQVTPRTEVK